jgi:hypothetical protein
MLSVVISCWLSSVPHSGHNRHRKWPCIRSIFQIVSVVLLACGIGLIVAATDDASFAPCKQYALKAHDTIPSSVIYWDVVNEPKKITILSAVVEHRHDGNWFIPSLHTKYSIGWNRSVSKGYLNRPSACNIRFYGIGLYSTLEKYANGGSGYMTFHFAQENFGGKGGRVKHMWHGFDKNETNKLYCYYETNHHYGSDFIVSLIGADGLVA